MNKSKTDQSELVIEIKNLCTYYGSTCIHDHLNLAIRRGETIAIVGGSGTGKTTLLRQIIMLARPAEGSIHVLNQNILNLSEVKEDQLRQRMGVMFQQGALFGSLTVLENIAFPLQEHTRLPTNMITEIAQLKLALVGLPNNAGDKYPRELSGGMLKRAAVARALALDPELLFLDEPTAGLDPVSASAFDALIVLLKKTLGLTIVMITHDLDTLWQTTDRVAFLGQKKVLYVGTMQELSEQTHPLIQNYFQGPRARAARTING